MKELAKAILVAMQEIGYLQKDKDVGAGKSAYKGLSDNKATQAIRNALIKANIVALPTGVEVTQNSSSTVFEGLDSYGNKAMKLYVFCEVRITYTLIHSESGESITVQAIGQGVDSGDKAAGKAMTYAKKNALLNSLLISSGLDADDTHSDDLPTPPPTKQTPAPPANKEAQPVFDLEGARAKTIEWCYTVLQNSQSDYRSEIGKAKNKEELEAIKFAIMAEVTALNTAYINENARHTYEPSDYLMPLEAANGDYGKVKKLAEMLKAELQKATK